MSGLATREYVCVRYRGRHYWMRREGNGALVPVRHAWIEWYQAQKYAPGAVLTLTGRVS